LFWKFKGFIVKINDKRKEKEKPAYVTLEVRKPFMPFKERGALDTIQMMLWKLLFGHWMPFHTSSG